MTVALHSSPYPEAIASNGHVETYREFAPSHVIPFKTRENEVQALLNKITSKEGFNPNLKFDPKTHIIFDSKSYQNTKTFTMADLKINKTHVPKVTEFGAAFPFPLLSTEAVDMILYEALQPQVVDKYGRLPNLATNATRLDFHIGGHAAEDAPFTNALARSPELTKIVSTFFGEELKPVYNSETAHINLSLATMDEVEKKKFPQTEAEIKELLSKQDGGDGKEIPSALGLHYDSATVTMVITLDLPEDAVGGQTTIVTGDEKSVRVPDPKVGYATIIQGRVLKHLASKPISNHNRITFVNAYAVAGPDKLDNTALTSTKPSVLPRARFDLFYKDWVDYKFRNLEAHLKYVRENVVADYEAGKGFDQEAFVSKCVEIESYFRKCYDEMECVNNPPYPPPHFHTPYADLP